MLTESIQIYNRFGSALLLAFIIVVLFMLDILSNGMKSIMV